MIQLRKKKERKNAKIMMFDELAFQVLANFCCISKTKKLVVKSTILDDVPLG